MSADKTLASAMRLKKKKPKKQQPCKPCRSGKPERDKRGRCRCYDDEYVDDHSSKKAKKDRAGRNKANAMVNPGKGKDAHHIDGNPQNNAPSNVAKVSVAYNRGESNRGRA